MLFDPVGSKTSLWQGMKHWSRDKYNFAPFSPKTAENDDFLSNNNTLQDFLTTSWFSVRNVHYMTRKWTLSILLDVDRCVPQVHCLSLPYHFHSGRLRDHSETVVSSSRLKYKVKDKLTFFKKGKENTLTKCNINKNKLKSFKIWKLFEVFSSRFTNRLL